MRIKIVIILFTACVLFFVGLGATSLWDPDEPRQAIMAREMMDRGDYIHPYLNGKPYLEKPPFYSWMIIVAAKLQGGLNEFASRVPSAVAATLLLFVAFFLGRKLKDDQAGFLSAMILAINYQFLSNARESVMDMAFAFFIGLTIFLNYIAISKKDRLLFILSFIPGALAILSKGPAGLVVPAAVTFIYLIVTKELKRYFLPMIVGCLLGLALASIWFLLAGPEYIKEFILRQNVTRYTNAFDHAETALYYFKKMFFNFLPWSIMLPFALVHAWRKKYWLPFIWFVVIFLFFEFSQSKRAIYLLSAYPAAALLCGLFMKDKWDWLVEKGWTGAILKAFGFLIAALPVAGVVALPFLPSSDAIEIIRKGPVSLYIYLGLLFVIALLFVIMLFKKSPTRAMAYLFIYLGFACFFHNAYYVPRMDAGFKSLRLITDELEPYKKTKEFYTLGFSSAGIIYYIGKPIHGVFLAQDVINAKGDPLFIVEKEPKGDIKEALDKTFQPIKRVKYEKEYYTFYVRKNG